MFDYQILTTIVAVFDEMRYDGMGICQWRTTSNLFFFGLFGGWFTVLRLEYRLRLRFSVRRSDPVRVFCGIFCKFENGFTRILIVFHALTQTQITNDVWAQRTAGWCHTSTWNDEIEKEKKNENHCSAAHPRKTTKKAFSPCPLVIGKSGRRDLTGSNRSFSIFFRDDRDFSCRNKGNACGVMTCVTPIISACFFLRYVFVTHNLAPRKLRRSS